jgi:putative PEP-CTERM system histidine kinase
MEAAWLTHPAFWSFGIAALAYMAFALQLSTRWRGDGHSSLLLGFVVLSAFWALTGAMLLVVPTAAMWFSERLFDALRMLTALAFLSLVLGLGRVVRDTRVRYTVRAVLVGVAAALCIAAFALGAPLPGAPIESGWSALAFAPLIGTAVLGLVLCEQVYRRTDERLKWNCRPLVLAFGGLFLFDLVLYSDAQLFNVIDPSLWSARGVVHAMAIPLLAMAAVRNPDWKFGIALSRGVLAGSTVLLVAACYLIGVALLGYVVRYVGGSWGGVLATVVVCAAALFLLLVTLSETFRAKVRVVVAKNFLAYRYDYRDEWLKFARTLSLPFPGESIAEACVRALASLVESPGGALWLQRPDGSFEQRAHVGTSPVEPGRPMDEPVVEFLRTTGWVIDLAEAQRDPAKYGRLRLPDWIPKADGAWLIVPLAAGDELIGCTLLTRPRVQFDVNWEVLDLLRTAARQASSYLAHMQATDALLEARKFEAFNRMSAFVVHDLKNLVAQLQLMLRNAQRHRANPEFQQDMLETVEHTVERMNLMMRQLRSGATPVESAGVVDLGLVAQRVKSVRASSHPHLELHTHEGVLAVGHEERLERVIGHLVQNALDAVGDAGRVIVKVASAGDEAVVEVVDNGPGMSPEFVRERLFKPFESTKGSGMGIGAYESQQYVQGLGGRIEVDSELGRGTAVRLVLRTAKAAPAVEPEEPVAIEPLRAVS